MTNISDDKQNIEASATDFPDDKQSIEVSTTDFSDEEYEKLMALQFDGYESMSVSDYHNKVRELTDTAEYQDLLERFSNSEKLYEMKDSDETAYFLFYILNPLAIERWKLNEFGGYAAANYPQASDNAAVEYTLTLEILDADALTVEDYDLSRRMAMEEMNDILDDMTISDLRDAEFMQMLLDEEVNNITKMWMTSDLDIEIQYAFRPLGELPEEDMAEWLKERQEEWDRTLAPYVPFGLTYQYDFATDDYKMYFDGKEVKSIYDKKEGLWIAEHSGSGEGIYDENAIELLVVYENGEITGLRDAGEQENNSASVTVTNVSFVSGMGCSDPDCTDVTHHHDCPLDCGDYEHHHNCALDCTIASHHHSGTSTVSGTTQHHTTQSHSGQHHKDDHH